MENEEVMTDNDRNTDIINAESDTAASKEKGSRKKERRGRDPEAFSRFESRYHVTGNILILLICLVLIFMCAYANVTFDSPFTELEEPVSISQNMIQLATAFTAFAMNDEELQSFCNDMEGQFIKIALEEQEKYLSENPSAELTAPVTKQNIASAIASEYGKLNYAKYVLAKARIALNAETPAEESGRNGTLIDIEKYVAFGLVVLGMGACLPMALAMLALAILVIKGLFITAFFRNGKSLHVAYPLTCMFTMLALTMMQLGAGVKAGIFTYLLFGVAFAGMLIVGIVRYAAYPNKFIGKGLVRYMLMNAAFLSAFSVALSNPFTVETTSGASSVSIGSLIASGVLTSNVPAEFEMSAWLIPLGLEVVMIFATFILGCIMASKTYIAGDRWRKRQWKARNELTTFSAILVTGFTTAFAYGYTYIVNGMLGLDINLTLSFTALAAPAVLALLFILLLIIRPTKKVKVVNRDDVDE